MSRSTDEWIGKNDDSRPPPRVRLRVFLRFHGRCYLSGRPIRPGDAWDVDHIVALTNGGANREDNLAPVLKDKHKEKTAQDVKEKATVYRKQAKHLGIDLKQSRKKMQSRGFLRAEPQRSASRPVKRGNRWQF